MTGSYVGYQSINIGRHTHLELTTFSFGKVVHPSESPIYNRG